MMSLISFQSFSDELEKIALLDQVAGGFIGHHYGKKQKGRGEAYKFGPAQVASALVPGGIGYQVGRYVAHHPTAKSGKAKQSSVKGKLLGLGAAASLAGGYGHMMSKEPVGKAIGGIAADGFKSLRQKALKSVQPTNNALQATMRKTGSFEQRLAKRVSKSAINKGLDRFHQDGEKGYSYNVTSDTLLPRDG